MTHRMKTIDFALTLEFQPGTILGRLRLELTEEMHQRLAAGEFCIGFAHSPQRGEVLGAALVRVPSRTR